MSEQKYLSLHLKYSKILCVIILVFSLNMICLLGIWKSQEMLDNSLWCRINSSITGYTAPLSSATPSPSLWQPKNIYYGLNSIDHHHFKV